MAKNQFIRAHLELDGLLPGVETVAQQAGALIMGFYNAPGSAAVTIKDDKTPVTDADRAASNYIETELPKLLPGASVISEENTAMPANGKLFWVVDPLDGTKEFIGRTGGFAVKIALMYDMKPVLGVVYAPVYDTLYSSVLGGPALKKTGAQQAVTLKTRPAPKKGVLTALFNRTHANPCEYDDQRLRLRQYGIIIPETPDITPGLPRNLQVAEGRADIHVNTGRHILCGGGYIWDNAADDLILKNAGGAMLAIFNGKAPAYRLDRLREPMPGYFAVGSRNRKLWKSVFPELKR